MNDTLAILDQVVSTHRWRPMDVVKKVNALKARKNLGQLLEEVYYKGDQYVIERAGLWRRSSPSGSSRSGRSAGSGSSG
jgi:hypothetical protein